ncbi:4-vinyl reductase [Paludibacterium yongneupense]|uniref:4-vinyl reductase n=1 Tax=Paludibacterium yongneupense TaxID=400061 RepID=UPI0004088E15|nr:4-vinyl reductase [Paludibacterium yongneupense]
MQARVPIEVDSQTGVWTTDGLPMLYVPRHFFINNHLAIEAALGRPVYAESLYDAGFRSAYYWCGAEAATHGIRGMAVFEHYLQRLSQRGWGVFSFMEADAGRGYARIRLDHSCFVLGQGVAGAPHSEEMACYLFAGWFAGAMDWVAADLGLQHATRSRETQCAGLGAPYCVFTVEPK